MMKTFICTILVTVFAFSLWAQTPQEKAQNAAIRNWQLQKLQQLAQTKPGAELTVHTEYIGKHLPDLVRYSDIIVYGRITAISNSYEYFAQAHHDYTVQVLQVIKPKGTKIPTVNFSQIGGDLYFGPGQYVHFTELNTPCARLVKNTFYS
jgi:hypothetical protein